MRQIKKIISIGSNCIATDWAHFLGIREKSPVDNFAEFQIWKSSSLFT